MQNISGKKQNEGRHEEQNEKWSRQKLISFMKLEATQGSDEVAKQQLKHPKPFEKFIIWKGENAIGQKCCKIHSLCHCFETMSSR